MLWDACISYWGQFAMFCCSRIDRLLPSDHMPSVSCHLVKIGQVVSVLVGFGVAGLCVFSVLRVYQI